MTVWTVGDIVTVYDKYVTEVLASSMTHAATYRNLRKFSGTRLTIVRIGTVNTGSTIYEYLEVTPEGAARNSILFFDSDATRDRAFRESQNAGSLGQIGEYIASSDSTPQVDASGILSPIVQTSTGAVANAVDNIGSFVSITTGTTVGDEALWATTSNEAIARLNNNPYMAITFMIRQMGEPRFFAGLANTNADPVTNVLVTSPLVGVAGVWFEYGTDTNFQFVSNGTSGALTKIDTGVAPTLDTLYLLEALVSGNGSSTGKAINFWLRDLGTFTAGKSGNLLASGTFSGTDIMGGSDNLMLVNGCRVASGSTATQLRTYWGSIELNS